MAVISSRFFRERLTIVSQFPLWEFTDISLYHPENSCMNKPSIFALAMFTSAVFGTSLVRSSSTQDEIHWGIELVSAQGIALLVYAVERWKQQKADSKSDYAATRGEARRC